MPEMAPAIVIVGAGECGTRAAFALREEGWDGRVILAGTEPSPPYERPPLSKTGALKPICDSGALREAGITYLPDTEAAGLDTAAHVLELADGRRLPYRSLLLATGVPWFWTDQHDYTLQVAGLADAASREVVRVRPDGVEIWFGLADGGRLVAAAVAGPANSVARDIRLAEMLIARRAAPDPAALADPGVGLKSVLRSPVAS
jgi:NADPH-dependent 2,4-dienoyl-CoA reductase/sulfur reductase-like enzyme